MDTTAGSTHGEALLATAAVGLTWVDVPAGARRAIRRLFLDWLGSALAGSRSTPVSLLSRVCGQQGWVVDAPPAGGSRAHAASTVLASWTATEPLAAALVNAASSHVVEMDDLHNASIYHPGTCVFPVALAVAESLEASGADLLTAAVAGYEVSLRVGEALGPEHYVYFHTTGTAGTIGAAVTAGHLLGLDRTSMLWALGNAATQAAGLWQFLAEGAMSKQLHAGKAAFDGALAAYLAAEGFTGPERGITGERGLLAATTAAGTPSGQTRASLRARQLERLTAGIDPSPHRSTGDRGRIETFKTPEVSIKLHPSCRHTHPAVDALLGVMSENGLRANELTEIRAHVYSGAYDRLKDVEAVDPWSAKFNLPFCLAQAALRGSLDLEAFTPSALEDHRVRELMERVTMEVDPSLDAEYPRRWPSWVEIETGAGARYRKRVDTPKGDPDNPLTDAELEAKFSSLANTVLPEGDVMSLLARIGTLPDMDDVGRVLRPVRPTGVGPSASAQETDPTGYDDQRTRA